MKLTGRVGFPVALLTTAVVATVAVHPSPFRTAKDSLSETPESWSLATARLERCVANGDDDCLREITRRILAEQLISDLPLDFTRAALLAAEHRITEHTGDPLGLLIAAERALDQQQPETQSYDLYLRLANAYSSLELHLRALEVATRADPSGRHGSASVIATSRAALSVVPCVGCSVTEAVSSPAQPSYDPVLQRLARLSGRGAGGPSNGSESEERATKADGGVEPLVAPATSPTDGFLAGFIDSHNPRLGDRLVLKSVAFRRLPIEHSLQMLVNEVLEKFRGDPEYVLLLGGHPLTASLHALLFGQKSSNARDEYSGDNNVQFDSAVPLGGRLGGILIRYAGDSGGAIVILRKEPQVTVSLYASNWYSYVPDVRLSLVEGHDALVLTNVDGSSAVLDAEIFDLESLQRIASVESLDRGRLAFLNIDDDPDEEILIANSNSDGDCNQCPSTHSVELLDYSRSLRHYVSVSRRTGRGRTVVGTHPGLWGMSLRQFRGYDGKRSGRLVNFCDRVSRKETQLRESVLEYLSGYDVLTEENRLTEAAALMESFVASADCPNLEDEWKRLRVWARMGSVAALLNDGRFSEAGKLLAEPWVKFVASVGRESRVAWLNMVAIAEIGGGSQAVAYAHLMSALDDEPENGQILGNLAWFANRIGLHEDASQFAARALDAAIREEDYGDGVRDMIHLAVAASSTQDYRDALDWYWRALGLARETRDSAGLALAAMSLLGAARIANQLRRPDSAIELLDEALVSISAAIWKDVGASLLLEYGRALAAAGRSELSIRSYRTSVDVGLASHSAETIWAAEELSLALERQGRRQEALAAAEMAVESAARLRRSLDNEGQKFSYIEGKKRLVSTYIRLARSSGLADWLIASKIDGWKYRTFIDVYGSRLGLSESEGFRSQASVGAMLRPGEAYVSYFVTADASYASVVSASSGVRIVALDIDERTARNMVLEIQSEMNISNPDVLSSVRRDEIRPALRQVLGDAGSRLIRPLKLPFDIDSILVSPDDALLGMPWSALTSDDVSVAAQYSIIVVPSMEFLQRPVGRMNNDDTALLVGALAGCHTKHGGSTSLGSLARGAAELETVVSELGNHGVRNTLLVDMEMSSLNQAGAPTTAAVVRGLSTTSLVHVVAHGLYRADRPLESAIVLQCDSESSELLTVRDLAGADLSGLRLITLATCDSGRGAEKGGAEASGFVRALMGAGARSVVASHWQLDDASSHKVFGWFYAAVADRGPALALAHAKRQLMVEKAHPFFWAALDVYGRPWIPAN